MRASIAFRMPASAFDGTFPALARKATTGGGWPDAGRSPVLTSAMARFGPASARAAEPIRLPSDRQVAIFLNDLHRDFGLDVCHALDAREVHDLELAIVVEIPGDDAQDEIAIACHEEAINDVR